MTFCLLHVALQAQVMGMANYNKNILIGVGGKVSACQLNTDCLSH
jgi:hypothetical protein